jgi:hypothetical protein
MKKEEAETHATKKTLRFSKLNSVVVIVFVVHRNLIFKLCLI